MRRYTFQSRCEMKMLVCGETLLTDLCDKITCPSSLWTQQPLAPDEEIDFDISFGVGPSIQRSLYKSITSNLLQNIFRDRFLFIHDTFYVDVAGEDSTKEIRKFLARKRDEIGSYESRDMQGVRISELTLRLGQPYLFQHQGNCEHLLIFSDLRLLNASDEQLPERYPIQVYDTRTEILCRVCRRVMAV
jgi:hypothetical protein